MATPESKVKADVEKQLFIWGFIKAGTKECNWPARPSGWYYMPVQTGYGVNGIPDFICQHKGYFFAIETKAPGKLKSLSVNQERRIKEITTGYGTVFVVDSAEMLAKEFEAWLCS